MKKIICLILILFAFCSIALAQEGKPSEDIKAIANAFEDTKLSKSLSLLYIKGLAREKIGAYDDAFFAYDVILSKCQTILADRDVTKTNAEGVIPFAVAAAYRKGIITHRSIEGSVIKLYKQLKMYEDAEKWINEILKAISNLELENGILIPEKEYGVLYYARAYNKAGWAYAMFNGSYWKRYIIYTPSEVIRLVDKAVEDLNQMYKIYCMDENDNMQDIDKSVNSYVLNLGASSPEYLTLELAYDVMVPELVAQKLIKQLKFSVKSTIDLYNSQKIKTALERGRRIYTYEEFVKPETKEVIAALFDILDEMKGK